MQDNTEMYKKTASKYAKLIDHLHKQNKQEKWDKRFMQLANDIALWSKDPSTKVGSVIVRPDRSIASTGFNGFPPSSDDRQELYLDSEYKGKHVVHAEDNCLQFTKDNTLTDYTIYTSFPPCPDCVKLIAKSGIRRVVTNSISYCFKGRDSAWINKWSVRFSNSLAKMSDNGIIVKFMQAESSPIDI